MEEVGLDFGLEHLIFKSFRRNFGYNLQISAYDTVFAMDALLDGTVGSIVDVTYANPEQTFWLAFDSLSSNHLSHIEKGIEFAIVLQNAILRVASSLIEKKVIVSSGPFRSVLLNSSSDLYLFNQPFSLIKLGLFLMEAVNNNGRGKQKPFLICCSTSRHSTLIVGLNPKLVSQTKRNKFGVAFEAAAEKTNTRIQNHYFDSAVIEILEDDTKKFLEYLSTGIVG